MKKELTHNPPTTELENLLPTHWIKARAEKAETIEIEATEVA